MLATLTTKGQVTLPKAIRDQLGLDAGSVLDFDLLPDRTITVKPVKPDARRLRGLLKSPFTRALSVQEMDEAVSEHLRDKHQAIASAR